MPERDVRTLRDLIWHRYAKIIAKGAFGSEAKRERYGFLKQTPRGLSVIRKSFGVLGSD